MVIKKLIDSREIIVSSKYCANSDLHKVRLFGVAQKLRGKARNKRIHKKRSVFTKTLVAIFNIGKLLLAS